MPPTAAPAFPIDIIGAGVTKCGTTSLWHVLERQSWFSAPIMKEPSYFSRNFHRGPAWYASLWATDSGGRLRGEFSPNYLRHPEAAARMRAHSPAARIIVSLRNPISRAVSHHRMLGRNSRSGRIPLDVVLRDSAHSSLRDRIVEPGHYARQLRRLLEHFPRSQIHVMILERVISSPEVELAALLEHVAPGRPRLIPAVLPVSNESYTPLSPAVDRRLGELRRAAIASRRTAAAGRIGRLRRALRRRGPGDEAPVPPSVLEFLAARYADGIEDLRTLLEDRIPEWPS